ncbi:uncharacterized protein LOC141899790 [Tubulanus polymorphus]|uniref:uncharacterized protein LOC141899790 n=1 Tax=Tubulanus polymorphus TaxID=672921 RepID=UPI003DA4D2FE
MELVKRVLVLALFTSVVCLGSSAKPNKNNGKKEQSWCCSIETERTEKMQITEAKLIMKNITRTSIIGYKECEDDIVPGQYDCPIYKEYISQVPRYVIQHVTKQVHLNVPCPKQYLHCCDGYKYVNGQCLTKEDAEIAEMLGNLGLG